MPKRKLHFILDEAEEEDKNDDLSGISSDESKSDILTQSDEEFIDDETTTNALTIPNIPTNFNAELYFNLSNFNVRELCGLYYHVTRVFHEGSTSEENFTFTDYLKFPLHEDIFLPLAWHNPRKPKTSISKDYEWYLKKKSFEIIMNIPQDVFLLDAFESVRNKLERKKGYLELMFKEKVVTKVLEQSPVRDSLLASENDTEENRVLSLNMDTQSFNDSEIEGSLRTKLENDVEMFCEQLLQNVQKLAAEGRLFVAQNSIRSNLDSHFYKFMREGRKSEDLSQEEKSFIGEKLKECRLLGEALIRQYGTEDAVNRDTNAFVKFSPWQESNRAYLDEYESFKETNEYLSVEESSLLTALTSDLKGLPKASLFKRITDNFNNFESQVRTLMDKFPAHPPREKYRACKYAVNKVHQNVNDMCLQLLQVNHNRRASAKENSVADINCQWGVLNSMQVDIDNKVDLLPLAFKDSPLSFPVTCGTSINCNWFLVCLYTSNSISNWLANFDKVNNFATVFAGAKNAPLTFIGVNGEFTFDIPVRINDSGDMTTSSLLCVLRNQRKVKLLKVLQMLRKFCEKYDCLDMVILPIVTEKGAWAYGTVFKLGVTEEKHKFLGTVDGKALKSQGIDEELTDEGRRTASVNALIQHCLLNGYTTLTDIMTCFENILSNMRNDNSKSGKDLVGAAVQALYNSSPSSVISNAKSISEYVRAQLRDPPAVWKDNKVKIAWKMWNSFFQLFWKDGINVENGDWNDIVDGPIHMYNTAAHDRIFDVLQQLKDGNKSIISILKVNKINPEHFVNAVWKRLLTDDKRGRLLILHSSQKMTGKTSVARALMKTFDGRRIAPDIKKNVDAKFESVDDVCSGLVVLEDLSEDAMEMVDKKLRPLVDGDEIQGDRKYKDIKPIAWPPVILTTNCEIEKYFVKRVHPIRFQTPLDESNVIETLEEPGESSIVGLFWKYSLVPHCTVFYGGKKSAFSPCQDIEFDEHHFACPLTDSLVASCEQDVQPQIDLSTPFPCPFFERVERDVLLFHMNPTILRKVFQVFQWKYITKRKNISVYSQSEMEEEWKILKFFYYLILPFCKVFYELYQMEFVSPDMPSFSYEYNTFREPFNEALFDRVTDVLRAKIFAPVTKKLFLQKYYWKESLRCFDGLCDSFTVIAAKERIMRRWFQKQMDALGNPTFFQLTSNEIFRKITAFPAAPLNTARNAPSDFFI